MTEFQSRRLLFGCFVVALAVLAADVACAQKPDFIPRRQDKPPGPALSPENAAAKMTVPDGFKVEVVAAEPDLVNPVGMTIDERGRFWVCESLEYPRRSPGVGRDRVKVLEDTTGDGKVDKTTVFADGLNIPSGIAVGWGGVWVANAPDILFMQDTDGDGKADKREVVVTGFGRDDTHELPNSLTWGPDGWLYGLNGVFNHSHVKYPPGSLHAKDNPDGFKFTCALFRIHPRTREFQVFAEGTSNPWGVAWDPEGSAFISACVIDHLWHLTETGYYQRQGGPYPPYTWKLGSIVKHKHQKAAYCGIHYFDSDAYPQEYRDRLYMGNIHGGCINVDVLERAGSTYFAKPAPDFLTANDVWFMPVVQKTGPDGCLYILDWYDRYHCYQDANADPTGVDRLHGRLYRVRYKDAPRVHGFDLTKESDDDLIKRLHGPNVYFRDLAQRLLAERNNAETRKKLERLSLDEAVAKKTRLHALWALVSGGPLDVELHRTLLTHKDVTFRAWGVRAAGNMPRIDDTVRERVAEMAADPAGDVRVQVAIAARKIDGLNPVDVLAHVLAESGDDALIPHIVWQNVEPLLEDHAEEFIAALKKRVNKHVGGFEDMTPHLVDRVLAIDDVPPRAIAEFAKLLQQTFFRDGLAKCLEQLAEWTRTGQLKGERLAAMQKELTPVLQDLRKQDRFGAFEATFLMTLWGDASAADWTRDLFADRGKAWGTRARAVEVLVAANDPKLIALATEVLTEPKAASLELRQATLESLARSGGPDVSKLVLDAYPRMDPTIQPAAIEMLTQRVNWSKELLAAVGRKEISTNALNLNQVRRLLATGDKDLIKQIGDKWGVVRNARSPQRDKVLAEMKQFIQTHPGDVDAGQKVYAKVCGQCHKMYGQGNEVGPDITLNGRNSFDQLLSNVFDPNLVIGAAYRAHTVVTVEGRTLTGLLVEDTPGRITLKIQGGKRETIARDDIELMKASEISMMPEQLEKQLKPDEIADLFAYITLDRPPSDPNARRLPGVRPVEPRQSSNPKEFARIVQEVAPGFSMDASGEGGVSLLSEHMGRAAVVRTHPVDRSTPCVLKGSFNLPADKKATLVLSVAHHQQGDWKLSVRVNGETLLNREVGPKTTTAGWVDLTVDLSRFAGKRVKIELKNEPTGWANEYGYWGRAAVLSSQ